MMRSLWNKLRSGLGRGVEDGLAEEMRLHREMLEESFRAEGLSETEARHRAARQFGPALTALEASRSEWTLAWMESVWFDVRYALRALARSRAFAATAVATLGAGLGLAAVAFTLFNAYVLRPFAVSDPASLYEVTWRGPEGPSTSMFTPQQYETIRARRDVFDDALATRNVAVPAGPGRSWQGVLVSGNYFRSLGARTVIGRPIGEEDSRVVVLSHDVWRTAFGADAAVLGKSVRLRGLPFEIVGVAAPEFAGLATIKCDFWAPIPAQTELFRGEPVLMNVVGRVRAGLTEPRAEAALAALARDSRPGEPGVRADLRSKSAPVEYAPQMLLLFAPVVLALGLVLATCCANVANMMLARGLARQREIGVRLAVGAGRARLVRQLVTEALIIAGLAGLAGLALSQLALNGGLRLVFASLPTDFAPMVRLHELDLDYRVYLFTLVLAALSAVGAALLPALQSTRLDLTNALRGEFGISAMTRSSRLRDLLVVAQVVVCVVLLVCGALVYRRAAVLQAVDPGMNPRGVVDLNLTRQQQRVTESLLAGTGGLVESAVAVRRVPWYGRPDRTLILAGEGKPLATGFNIVSPEYFTAFRIPILRGRPFTGAEARAGAPVAIVSEATAKAFWPNGEDPIGQTLQAIKPDDRRLGDLGGDYATLRVIGVARDVASGWLFEGRDPTCLYLPAAIGSERAPQTLVQLRDSAAGAAGFETLRRHLRERWPDFDGGAVAMTSVLALQLYPFRAAAWIAWLLGLVALGLAVSGLYGVLSYLVTQRSKEIGIRVALGATPGAVVTLVLRRCAALSGAGALIGSLLSAGAVQLLIAWSASVRFLEWDIVAIVSGAAIALAAALLAAAGPSRRAAGVDPNQVLRA